MARGPHLPPDFVAESPWFFETRAKTDGFRLVAGIDEAGRGPLAGPVVAAAVILPENFDLTGIDDSKKLSEIQRESVFSRIVDGARAVGIGLAEPDEIDRINILQATYAAMRRALGNLKTPPDFVFVDGLPVPNLHNRCESLVKGDSRCASIAAASIVAKVTRDRRMIDADTLYPGYGFARHKGYYAQEHIDALARLGPCPIHRRSFAPISQLALDL